MGYILPVPFYQYQDYQQRVTPEKQNPYYIERPFRVLLNSTHKNIEKREDIFFKYNHRPAALHIPKTTHKSRQTEKIYADLTGKGQRFNESI